MSYLLFKGFNLIDTYPTETEAKKAINSKGIWNICAIKLINGKLTVINRETEII